MKHAETTSIIGLVIDTYDTNYTHTGKTVTNVQVKVNTRYYTPEGEILELTNTYRCAFWGNLAHEAARIRMGDTIGVEGRVKAKSFTGYSGNPITYLELNAESFRVLQDDDEVRPGEWIINAPVASTVDTDAQRFFELVARPGLVNHIIGWMTNDDEHAEVLDILERNGIIEREQV